MLAFRRLFVVFIGLTLSSCASVSVMTDRALSGQEPLGAFARDYRVASLDVVVPRSLKVSEANSFHPDADIVWREDFFGDRHAQVEAILIPALERGTRDLDGARPVAVEIELVRFHSLTDKARRSTGGVHSIRFYMTLRDPASGEVIERRRLVNGDLEAFGGQQAADAVARGQTQKVRISDHLAELIETELSPAARAL